MSSACCTDSLPTLESAAAQANIFAAPESFSRLAGPADVSAWLDRADRIVHLSPTWDEHADEPHRRSQILARPIGWFISDPNIRECFRALLVRVRREHRGARLLSPVDGPGERRVMRLAFTPLSAGAIEITWALLDRTTARRVAPAARHHFQEGELLRMCGWCHDVNLENAWQRLEDAAPALGLLDHGSLPSITHGICPTCCGAMASEALASQRLAVAV